MRLDQVDQAEKEKKKLQFFSTHYSFGNPFKVLFDADFLQLMARDKNVIGNIRKVLGVDAKLFVTRCVKVESGVRMDGFLSKKGVKQVDRSIEDHVCHHHSAFPEVGVTCVDLVIDKYNAGKFILATCDRARAETIQCLSPCLPVMLGLPDGSLSIMYASDNQKEFALKMDGVEVKAKLKDNREKWKKFVKRNKPIQAKSEAKRLKNEMKEHQRVATKRNREKREVSEPKAKAQRVDHGSSSK